MNEDGIAVELTNIKQVINRYELNEFDKYNKSLHVISLGTGKNQNPYNPQPTISKKSAEAKILN